MEGVLTFIVKVVFLDFDLWVSFDKSFEFATL